MKAKYLVIILLLSSFLLSSNTYAHCKWNHPHHCIKKAIEKVTVAGKFVYKNGKKAYKIGKPHYRKGILIVRPVYDLYTGNYIGFINSSGKLVKEL